MPKDSKPMPDIDFHAELSKVNLVEFLLQMPASQMSQLGEVARPLLDARRSLLNEPGIPKEEREAVLAKISQRLADHLIQIASSSDPQ
jgi:hypothetical protein